MPDKKIIIFVDGCYWHACPIHFPENKKRISDASRVNYLKAFGYHVEIIWEHDIYDDSDAIVKGIIIKYE